MAANNWKAFFEDLRKNWDSIPEDTRKRIYHYIDDILCRQDMMNDRFQEMEDLYPSPAMNKQKNEGLEEVKAIEEIWLFVQPKA